MFSGKRVLMKGAALAALMVPMLAGGGLYVTVGNPEAHRQAREMGAVLTLRLAGCHEPEKVPLTGAAIGYVNGQRQTIPLKLVALAEPGTYAIKQEWPKAGRWVLRFIAQDGGRVASTLVPAGEDGVERTRARMEMNMPAESAIAEMLAPPPKQQMAKQ